MAHVLNYPVNTSDAMDKWRADAAERKATEERFKKELGPPRGGGPRAAAHRRVASAKRRVQRLV
jgi:hypothetical protein